MNLTQLETFVVVAEELHFRRAADRLFTQPSTVSVRISQLETEVGTDLFVRSSRKVQLSPAGEQLLTKARAALGEIADLKLMAKAMAETEPVSVSVGFLDEGLAELSQVAHDAFVARFPNAEAPMEALDYADVQASLVSERVDVVVSVLSEAWFDHAQVVSTPLFEESRSVVLPRNHPLTQFDEVETAQLLDEPFLRVDGLPDEVHDFFMLTPLRTPERSPDVDVTATHMHNLLNHVARGAGVFTVTRANERFYPRPDIVYLPVRDLPSGVVHIVRRADDDRTHVQAYIDECVRAVRTSLHLIPTATDATPSAA